MVSRGDQGDRDAIGGDPSAPSTRSEATAPYQDGYRAGYGEAEVALRSAHESALQSGHRAGFERGLEEGRQQGVTEGVEAGRRAVEQDARAGLDAIAARVKLLDQLLSTMPAALEARLASSEDDMVALSHRVICRILGEQLVTGAAVADCVRRAIHDAAGAPMLHGSGHPGFAIHVHPHDLELLAHDEGLARWLRQGYATKAAGVQWVADDSVRLGGCVVRSGEGSLDARIETQMAALREVLLHGRAAAATDPVAEPAQVARLDETARPPSSTEAER
jgi:flagellar assembly protein FliH